MAAGTKNKLKGDRDYEGDKDARIELCRQLCSHLADGYSIECFSEVSTKRLARLMDTYEGEFPAETIDKARNVGRYGWELIGKRQADGRCLGNSRTWFYNMSNRYGWRDKVDTISESKGSLSVNVVNYSSTRSDKPLADAPRVPEA